MTVFAEVRKMGMKILTHICNTLLSCGQTARAQQYP